MVTKNKNTQCEHHIDLALEVRETRVELRGARKKLDKIEKLCWALVASIGACAAALGLSPDLPTKIAMLFP